MRGNEIGRIDTRQRAFHVPEVSRGKNDFSQTTMASQGALPPQVSAIRAGT